VHSTDFVAKMINMEFEMRKHYLNGSRPVAFVTGGGRGIGRATVLRLAQGGWDICLTWTSDEASAIETVQVCTAFGSVARAVRADIACESDIIAAFDVAQNMGPLVAVINNAGVLDVQCHVKDMSVSRVARILNVNVLGTIICCREAVRRLNTDFPGGGSIVNVSSRAAVLGGAFEYVDYAASKAAIDALTIGLAKEVARLGIRVNSVRPALINTGIHAAGGEPDRVERLADLIPMGRGGEPEEVAAAIIWLLSPESSFVTGITIDVSGGL
jgi:NAD(P)-dependent dehydrogenase (short-subunit alcohol dehydrogenase family)